MSEFILKKENGYVLEIWGGSTRHPDVRFYMQDDIEYGKFVVTKYLDIDMQVYQWLLYCASRVMFPTTAHRLVDWAFENYYNV